MGRSEFDPKGRLSAKSRSSTLGSAAGKIVGEAGGFASPSAAAC